MGGLHNLKNIRHYMGLTQLEFSKKIKVTQSCISRVENGKIRNLSDTVNKRIMICLIQYISQERKKGL